MSTWELKSFRQSRKPRVGKPPAQTTPPPPPEALQADAAVTNRHHGGPPTRDLAHGRDATGMEEEPHHQAAEDGRPQREGSDFSQPPGKVHTILILERIRTAAEIVGG